MRLSSNQPNNAPTAKKIESRVESNVSAGTNNPKPLCFNCKSDEHLLLDCTAPFDRIFCFRCGRENVRAPECTCRKPKN